MNQSNQSYVRRRKKRYVIVKIIAIVEAVLLVFAILFIVLLLNRRTSPQEQSPSITALSTVSKASPSPVAKENSEYSMDFVDCHVEILDGVVANGNNGKDYLIVTFEWSHTLPEGTFFEVPVSTIAYQDGVSLEKEVNAHFYGIELEHDTITTAIKSGVTFKVQQVFELRNTTSDVEVEVSDFYTEGKLARNFEL